MPMRPLWAVRSQGVGRSETGAILIIVVMLQSASLMFAEREQSLLLEPRIL